jgi:hypothetical protein
MSTSAAVNIDRYRIVLVSTYERILDEISCTDEGDHPRNDRVRKKPWTLP